MKAVTDKAALFARAEAHASLLETAATLMELDGIGTMPDQGHVHHLRRMAGSIRAQAALGRLAQTYSGGRYLPDPALCHPDSEVHAGGADPSNKAVH